MTRTLTSSLVLLAGCKLAMPIPEGQVDQLAKDLCAVGHPTATYSASRVTDFTTGGMFSSTDKPTLEVEIDYEPALGKKTRTMVVQVTVESTDPCTLRTDVLSDSGAVPPVLLDNGLASSAAGAHICDSLTGTGTAAP